MRKFFFVIAILTMIIARNYSDLWGLGREFFDIIDETVKSETDTNTEQKWDDIYINGENKGYFAKISGLGLNDPTVFIEAAVGGDDNNWILRVGQKDEKNGGVFIPTAPTTPQATPIPTTAWLLATGLIGLVGMRKKWFKKKCPLDGTLTKS